MATIMASSFFSFVVRITFYDHVVENETDAMRGIDSIKISTSLYVYNIFKSSVFDNLTMGKIFIDGFYKKKKKNIQFFFFFSEWGNRRMRYKLIIMFIWIKYCVFTVVPSVNLDLNIIFLFHILIKCNEISVFLF